MAPSNDEKEGAATTNSTTSPFITTTEGMTPQQMRGLLSPNNNKTRPTAAFSQKSLYFGIPSNHETRKHAGTVHGEDSWRFKVVLFLHTPVVQKTLMMLLALDVALLFLEMFLLATFPHCSVIERDAVSCCPISEAAMTNLTFTAATDDHADTHERWLRSLASSEEDEPQSHHLASLCAAQDNDYASTFGSAAACDEHKWHTVHVMEQFIFAVTIGILSCFWIELNFMAAALGPGTFFSQFFFALDYMIVTISIVLEVVFYVKMDEIYQSLAGILVIVRLWRFFRIGHGIVEVTHELAQEEYHKLEYYKDELEALLRANNIALPAGFDQHNKNSHSVHGSGSGGHNTDNTPALLVAVEQHHHRQSMIRSSSCGTSGEDGAAAAPAAAAVEVDIDPAATTTTPDHDASAAP